MHKSVLNKKSGSGRDAIPDICLFPGLAFVEDCSFATWAFYYKYLLSSLCGRNFLEAEGGVGGG